MSAFLKIDFEGQYSFLKSILRDIEEFIPKFKINFWGQRAVLSKIDLEKEKRGLFISEFKDIWRQNNIWFANMVLIEGRVRFDLQV